MPINKSVTSKRPNLFETWSKYEEVAMHFNDLLLKIRTQALGVVATLVTVVGIFAKTSDVKLSWEMAAGAFLFLGAFWVAIWILDFRYYNRLLLGAVLAIVNLEKQSKKSTRIKEINLSREIERAVRDDLTKEEREIAGKLSAGRWQFYIIVFSALFLGFIFCLYEIRNSNPLNIYSGGV